MCANNEKFMYDKNFSLKRFKRIAKQNLNCVIILTENEKVKALNKYREKHFWLIQANRVSFQDNCGVNA